MRRGEPNLFSGSYGMYVYDGNDGGGVVNGAHCKSFCVVNEAFRAFSVIRLRNIVLGRVMAEVKARVTVGDFTSGVSCRPYFRIMSIN